MAKTIYLDMKGFSKDKSNAFDSSINIKRNQSNMELDIKSLFREEGKTDWQDVFFSSEIRSSNLKVEGEKPKIEQIETGEYKGFYKITLDIIVKFKGKALNSFINIYSKTEAIARQIFDGIRLNRGDFLKDTKSKTPAELIDKIKNKIRNEQNLNEQELKIEFKNEFGNTQIVLFMTLNLGV